MTRTHKLLIITGLLIWLALLITFKIDLTSVDLGRHLKNGELVFDNFHALLNTNFYSYTYPDYPFLNHHWLSGLIFYLVWVIAGFTGLSIFFTSLYLIVFLMSFRLAWKLSDFNTAALFSVIVIPLIASRHEIRPEIWSYLFAILFLYILFKYKFGEINKRWLLILPVMLILWANLHVYFLLGLGLIGLFLFDQIIIKPRDPKKIRYLLFILVLAILASLINPFGYKVLLSPAAFWANYGYRIVENQSVWFLYNFGVALPKIILFIFIAASVFISFIFQRIKSPSRFSSLLLILNFSLAVLSFLAIRNFSLFALFALPTLAYNLHGLYRQWRPFMLGLTGFFLVMFLSWNSAMFSNLGLGLAPNNHASAQFFLEQNIKGPIFNNYDIGGYLIYYIFPKEKVFVDNRPEAYPTEFFEKTYIPMQEDEQAWKSAELQFNVIYFNYHDLTNWAQKFLLARVNDPAWAPVYADGYAIIFLKRTEQNQNVIIQHELSKDMFRVSK